MADAWKLGRKGVDDGVLLLVAKDNPAALRRLRIETGRRVQGVLTDAQAKRVLQDVIAPHLRQQDYYAGLTAGVGAIATLLNQEQFPAPQYGAGKQAKPHASEDDLQNGLWGVLLVFFAALLLVRRRRGSALARQGGWGSGASGVLLGATIGGGFGGGSSASGGSSGFGGGGGSFDGGGASGNW